MINFQPSATTKKKRITPTQRQLAVAALLDDDALLELSVRALHALNRRAKEKRDREASLHWNTRAYISDAIRGEIEGIYTVKTAFLDRVVRSGIAAVESFEVEGRHQDCAQCGRSWVGDTWCYECEADTGEPNVDTWYIVEACGHRFHQPPLEATAAMRAAARQGEPHDPTQPQREIPDVGLTIEAQFGVVRMMSDRLIERAHRVFRAKSRAWLRPRFRLIEGGASMTDPQDPTDEVTREILDSVNDEEEFAENPAQFLAQPCALVESAND